MKRRFLPFTFPVRYLGLATALIFRMASILAVPPERHAASDSAVPSANTPATARKLKIPQAELIDQDGRRLDFGPEFLRGKVAAINFIFTTCPTVCPLLGAHYARLEESFATPDNKDVELISITVDPSTDTPERLRTWAQRFGRKGKWRLLTGSPDEVEKVLRAFTESAAGRENHSPMVWIGGEHVGGWRRVDGVTATTNVASMIRQLTTLVRENQSRPNTSTSPSRAAKEETSDMESHPPVASRKTGGHPYFPDVELIDQDGHPHRFYSDILQGRVVLIHSFFTECQSVCPTIMNRLGEVRLRYQGEFDQQLRFVSISVDPLRDTPAMLHAYAERLKLKPGWLLLTGTKENVDLVLGKLGQLTATREGHGNLLIMGNEPTGLWKKGFGLASAKDLGDLLGTVLDDGKSSAPLAPISTVVPPNP
ncbi:MAG TPA: SCO family protein [Candidatus Limnocylindria bacterium]|nr:SCO family protein [Candidatus Limnocylindria bacterium]